jgi:hypothetical protein
MISSRLCTLCSKSLPDNVQRVASLRRGHLVIPQSVARLSSDKSIRNWVLYKVAILFVLLHNMAT